MRFPFEVEIEWPEFPKLGRARPLWLALATALAALGLGIVATVWQGRVSSESEALTAILEVDTTPAGASVEVDGSLRGSTPAVVALAPGEHRLRLRRDGYLDSVHTVHLAAGETVSVRDNLWRRRPTLRLIRPPLPGATIADGNFLADGKVALTVGLPPGEEIQTWVVEPDGTGRRVGPSSSKGPAALAPDGAQIAYLAQGRTTASGAAEPSVRHSEVWVATADGRSSRQVYVLPADAGGEQLADLAWTPDGRHLLVVSRQGQAGGVVRSRLLWLEAQRSIARDLITIPSEVVPGSYSWDAAGEQVAFLARSAQGTSLCLIDLADGRLHYLADVGRGDAAPFPFTPLAWSPDGRKFAYTALAQGGGSQGIWPFVSKSSLALFVVDEDGPPGEQIAGDAQSPAWRENGSILVLARGKGDGRLALKSISPSGQAEDSAELDLRVGRSFAARWDMAHAQALVAHRDPSGVGSARSEFWLLRFGQEESR
ncbi:MAG: PEGA domain-containing protein [Chloroflexi bacterium]|nr:PEGA domain-containing protein [Chloroflexota bacterium]